MPLLFSTTTKTARLRAVFKGLTTKVNLALSSKYITYLLKKSITDRFEPAGTTKTAQTAPSGRRWAPMAEATMYPTRESQDRTRSMYDTSVLLRSIRVLYSRVSIGSLESNKGGGFIIGIRPGHPAYKYGTLLQENHYTPNGAFVPGRRFMGVTSDDTKEISKFLKYAVDGGLG